MTNDKWKMTNGKCPRSTDRSIDSHRCLGRELAERTNPPPAVPRILVAGLLALAFVSLQTSRNECLTSQSSQSHASGFAVADHQIAIVEFDDLDDGARLRRVISDLVAVLRRHRLRAGQ